MLFLAIAIFVLFFFLAYKNTLLALSATAALLPSYLLRFEVFGLPSTILEVMIWAVVLGWATKQLSLRGAERRGNLNLLKTRLAKIKYPLILFFLASIISIFISPDKFAAMGVWRAYFLESVLFFFLILAVVKNKDDFKKVIFGLSISALYLSLYAIGQRFFGLPIPAPWQEELRVTSLFPYPNAVGLFLAPIAILMIGLLIETFKKKSLTTYYLLLTATLSLMAITFAKSDGAIMALLAIGFLLMLANIFIRKKIRADFILIILVLVAAGLLFNMLAPVKDKILLRDWSGFVRLTIWGETWNMLKDNFIFGAGLNGYQTAILPYHESRGWMEVYLYPHNIILNFWSELGLLGLAGFVWLLERFGKMCYKLLLAANKILSSDRHAKTYAITAIAAMAVLLIHGLVDVPYFKNDLSILFWIIYAMPLAAKH